MCLCCKITFFWGQATNIKYWYKSSLVYSAYLYIFMNQFKGLLTLLFKLIAKLVKNIFYIHIIYIYLTRNLTKSLLSDKKQFSYLEL